MNKLRPGDSRKNVSPFQGCKRVALRTPGCLFACLVSFPLVGVGSSCKVGDWQKRARAYRSVRTPAGAYFGLLRGAPLCALGRCLECGVRYSDISGEGRSRFLGSRAPGERGVPVPPGAQAAGVISQEASRSPREHAGRGCGRGARRGGAGAPHPEVRAQAAGWSPWAAGPPGLGGQAGARSSNSRASRLPKERELRAPSVTVRGLALSRKPHLSVFKPHVRPRDVPSL